MNYKSTILFFLFFLSISDTGSVHGQEVLRIDTLGKNEKGFDIIYLLAEDTLSYGSVKNGMNHGIWRGFYRDGTPRYYSSYEHGRINGMSRHFHSNGELKCEIYHEEGIPVNVWKSFYDNSAKMSVVSWNRLGLPDKAEIYGKDGILLLVKKYRYDEDECAIDVKRFYRNGSPLEAYTTYITSHKLKENISQEGLASILNISPHLGLPFNEEGEISGFYFRYFNTGRLWMHLEFYQDKLIDVYDQKNADGNSIKESFEDGSGRLVHFHHYSDTAAIINYEEGVPDGPILYYHSKNNTHKKGFMTKGNPSKEWTTYSFSGKVKETITFLKDTAYWCLFGPKSNKYRTYPIVNGLLNGRGKEFDFYDRKAAEFSFSNGVLEGTYTRWLNENITRYGSYHKGEQIGDWITAGLFNPVSHTTSFNDKDIVLNHGLLPKLKFDLKPNIELPRLKLPVEKQTKSFSKEFNLYSSDQFKTILLELPDSDEVLGTSYMRLVIDENGNMEELNTIKSPSKEAMEFAKELIIKDALFTTQFIYGLPQIAKRYAIVEHFRN